MHKAAFDEIAIDYDEQFTNSATGQKQRQRVWQYLEQGFSGYMPLTILEINCGTGEDAIWLAKKGNKVVATDVSEKMIDVCRLKVNKEGLEERVNPLKCSFGELTEMFPPGSFDLVFSNFGGLNCVNSEGLQKLAADLNLLLKDQGRFIAVVMSKTCVWEIAYYLKKRNISEAFRRSNQDGIDVKLEEAIQKTYYYSSKDIRKHFANHFEVRKLRPVGFALPPSYMEGFFARHLTLLNSLNTVENMVGDLSTFSNLSDHFLIELQKNA